MLMSLLGFFWVASCFGNFGICGHTLWAKSPEIRVQRPSWFSATPAKPRFLARQTTPSSIFGLISPKGFLWKPLSESQPKQVKSFVQSWSWREPVESNLCQSGTDVTPSLLPALQTSAQPPVSFQPAVATTTQASPSSFLSELWDGLPFLSSTQPKPPAASIVEVRPSQNQQYEVVVKNQIVAQLPHHSQAQKMAQRLKNALQQTNNLSSEVMPAVVKGQPALKMGTNVILVIDEKLAAELKKSQEVLAIEWSNQLRLALGLTPLSLTEAQAQMHQLQETPRKLAGRASWYGPYFQGRMTAAGETYNQNELTAAHPSLPFDTYLKVTNLKNDKQVIVRVNDRGPYVGNRVLDLSREAARCLESEKAGVVPVEAVIMQKSS